MQMSTEREKEGKKQVVAALRFGISWLGSRYSVATVVVVVTVVVPRTWLPCSVWSMDGVN